MTRHSTNRLIVIFPPFVHNRFAMVTLLSQYKNIKNKDAFGVSILIKVKYARGSPNPKLTRWPLVTYHLQSNICLQVNY